MVCSSDEGHGGASRALLDDHMQIVDDGWLRLPPTRARKPAATPPRTLEKPGWRRVELEPDDGAVGAHEARLDVVTREPRARRRRPVRAPDGPHGARAGPLDTKRPEVVRPAWVRIAIERS